MTDVETPSDQVAPNRSVRRSLAAIGLWLVDPAVPLPAPRRRQSQILSGLLIALILMGILGTSVLYRSLSSFTAIDNPIPGLTIPITLCGTALLLLAYFLNRHGRYALATGLTIIVTALGVWGAVFALRDSYVHNPFIILYVLLSILLSSLLLSPRATVLIAIAQLAGILLARSFIAGFDLVALVNSILFVSFTTLVIVVGMTLRQRSQAELETQARALGESEQRFRLLFSASPDAVLLIDPHDTSRPWRIVDCNDVACRLYGYDRAELIGTLLDSLNAVPRPAEVRAARLEQIRREGVAHLEAVRRHKDGHTFSLEISATLVTFGGSELVLGIQRDVTERKRAAVALQESEAQFRGFVENTSDWILMTDEQGTVVEWNHGAEQITGLLRADTVGKPLWDVQYQLTCDSRKSPAMYDRLKTVYTEALRTGASSMMNRNIEAQFQRSDGSLRVAEQRLFPLRTAQGLRLSAVSRDVSERKLAEAALRESEERFRAVAQSANEAIIVADGHGKIVLWNKHAERAFLWTEQEVVGQPVSILIPDSYRERHHTAVIQRHAASAPPFSGKSYEASARRKDGTEFPAEISLATWESSNGQFYSAIVRDITERHQHERERDAIIAVSASLRVAPTRAEMLPVLLDQLIGLLKADGAALAMRYPDTGETVLELGRGSLLQATGLRLPPGHGISGQVIASGTAYQNNNVRGEPQAQRPDLIADVRAVACAPLVAQEQTIGALLVVRETEITGPEMALFVAISDMAANAIHRASLHELTEQRLRRLSALRAVDQTISSSLDLGLTLDVVLDQVIAQLAVDAADVLLLDQQTGSLDFTAGRGFRGPVGQNARLRLGESYAGRAALERRMVHIADLRYRKTDVLRTAMFAGEAFVAYVGVPLIAKGKVKGVLEIFHRAAITPGAEWWGFVETLAGQAAIAIDNAELFAEMQRANLELKLAYDSTVEDWGRALELRDRDTEGHTRRVAELTVRLARAMGLSESELVAIRRGALLHDIGKMGVPDAILLKPGPLTEAEWVVMKQHPTLAYEMLLPVRYLRSSLDIPYCHHEKWDGSGYPRGLQVYEIPLAARIFAVADVWDALMSDRPYRPGWPADRVLAYIRDQAGKHFDPEIVAAFLSLDLTEGH